LSVCGTADRERALQLVRFIPDAIEGMSPRRIPPLTTRVTKGPLARDEAKISTSHPLP
jgi:hypothetical protein